jgi:hypothetical protein
VLLDGIAWLAMMGPSGVVDRRVLSDEDAALDLLAVKYIVLRPAGIGERDRGYLSNTIRWREVDRFSTSRTSDRRADMDVPGEHEYVIFENRRALPRAWLAQEVIPLSDGALEDTIRLSRLRDGRPFEPARMALVDADAVQPGAFPPGDAGVDVTAIRDGSITVRVSSSGGGFLVLSEAYYPGWHARIDGSALQPVHRANRALQGLEVPPGQHVVVFEFTSRARALGAGLSAAGTLMLASISVGGWFRSRRRAD